MNSTILWSAVFTQGCLLAALILLMKFKKYINTMNDAAQKLQQAQVSFEKSQLKLDLVIAKLHQEDEQ